MPPPKKPTPLLRYLKVQEGMERQTLFILQRASAAVDRQLKTLEAKQGVGAAVRRDQLRAVKKSLQREVAGLWRLMGSEVNARRAEAAAAAITSMFDTEAVLWNAVMDAKDVEVLMRAAQAQARRSVSIVESRYLGYSNIPLSERVYKSRVLASGQVDRLVESALSRGLSARELAKEVRAFIKPGTPGGVSYAAQRLGRTELNNAFHATQVRYAVQAPWITAMKWNLSGSHPKPDECNDYADHGGDGLWTPSEVPAKPHPQCLCYVTPETVPRAQFIDAFESGAYDDVIDKIMRDGEMSF